jgi:hypothetical protein
MPNSHDAEPDLVGGYRPTQAATTDTPSGPAANEVDSAPAVRYAEGECSWCLQLLPKNQLRKHSNSRVTGYSSGATWNSGATNSADSQGQWQPSRIDASRQKGHISGQTFYEMQEIQLCPSCEDQYQEDLRSSRERLLWILAVIVISVVLFVGIVYLNNR